MESLILSFNAIAPIFVLMLLGYLLKKLNIADKKGFDSINKLVFKVFLPVLLFYNIYKTDIGNVFDIRLIGFVALGVMLIFAVGYFAVIVSTKDNAKRGVMLQGFFRSNFAILGVPLVGYICGDGSGGLASMMVAVVIPVFNILSVVALECFRGGDTRLNFLRLLKGILTNPLIIGCLLGIAFFLTGIKLPGILEKSVKDILSVATHLP
ncbi:MAG: AEC family transporter [Clostridia bacterium]|nr:AEC family transporter [Clostridia bacterium]